MSEDKPASRAELKEEIEGVKQEISGLETRIQTQFEVQSKEIDEKIDEKLAAHHSDIISKLDFLIEQAQGDNYDVLQTQIADHDQRISKLEGRQ